MTGATAGAGRLDAIFRPRSIALVGATDRENSVGRAVLENLLGGFRGEVFPVNPKARDLLGRHAFPSLADLPSPPDLAIIAVPSPHVPGVLADCGRLGIRGAVVLSAGFKECGSEGAGLEKALRDAAQAHGLSVIGPNCLGVINTDPEVGLNATFARRVPKAGPISFLSQSGALGVYALEYAASHDFGIRRFASLGNKAVLHENQVLEAFAEDEGARVLLAYLEDFRDPGGFLERAADIARGPQGKPVVLLKAGNGRSGRRAAASHTGAIAEKADFLDDLCAQYGILRAACLEDMFHYARYLSEQPLPRGPRLGVVTNAGGPAILVADEAERQGLSLPEPSRGLQARLALSLPAAAGIRNPVDTLGDSDAGRYGNALNTLVGAGEYDAVLALGTPQRMTPVVGLAEAVAGTAALARSCGTVLLASLAGLEERRKVGGILAHSLVPGFEFPEDAARALGAAWRHAAWKASERGPVPRPQGFAPDRAVVAAVLEAVRREGRLNLTEPESESVLRAYGLPIAPGLLVQGEHQLAAAAYEVGFPMVAKIVSPDIVHKVDAGGVIAGIDNAEELDRAHAALISNARKSKPGCDIRGILLQSTVRGGLEFLIGAQRHPHYGVLLLFGLGGTLVEAIHDVRFRRAPLSPADAGEMVRGIRAADILDHWRGKPPRDVPALMDCLYRLSWLLEDFREIAEADLNPVFALEHGARIADARLVLGVA